MSRLAGRPPAGRTLRRRVSAAPPGPARAGAGAAPPAPVRRPDLDPPPARGAAGGRRHPAPRRRGHHGRGGLLRPARGPRPGAAARSSSALLRIHLPPLGDPASAGSPSLTPPSLTALPAVPGLSPLEQVDGTTIPADTYTAAEVEAIITSAADADGVSPSWMISTAECESTLRPECVQPLRPLLRDLPVPDVDLPGARGHRHLGSGPAVADRGQHVRLGELVGLAGLLARVARRVPRGVPGAPASVS